LSGAAAAVAALALPIAGPLHASSSDTSDGGETAPSGDREVPASPKTRKDSAR